MKLRLAIGALALSISPMADAQGRNADIAASVQLNARGGVPVHALSDTQTILPDGIVAHTNITYAVPLGYRPLTLDLYAPAKVADGTPRPLLIYVHGGGWITGNPREAAGYKDWPALLARMAAKGYVVASVSYRLSREAIFPAALQDVKSAIRFLRSHAEDYGIDPKRFGIWGDSAGGHLVGLAGTTCGVAAFAPVIDPPRRPETADAQALPLASDCVQAVVGWYGIYDFMDEGPVKRPPAPANDPTRIFLGCTVTQCTEEQRRFVSPVTYVDASDAPMLLIHGSEDFAVPLKQSEIMAEKLNAVGVPARVIAIPGAGHGWFAKTPEETLAASRQALEATLDYFDTQLKP